MKRGFKKFRYFINKMDKTLLVVTLGLFIFGLLNIVTASSSEAVTRYEFSLYHYFFKQLQMIFIGIIGAIVIISIPSKKYKPYATIAFIIIISMTIYLTLNGVANRGSKNWISVAGIMIQPSEFAKPVIIVCLALYFEMYYKVLRNPNNPSRYSQIAAILFIGAFTPVLVFLQKDFGTMAITLGIFGVMFLASPILRIDKLKTIGICIILVFAGGLILYTKQGYILTEEQKERFDFLDPCDKYEQGGYQICNGYIAINDGGLLGLGIGRSRQKYSYIPEPHTDSVFAIIMEEYGLLKSALIFIAYMVVIYRILIISSRSHTIRGRYITIGVATYIFLHILVNLGGLLGVLPLTGVPLPFLSYGGSFTVSLIAALALVQRICIENKEYKEEKEKKLYQ